MVFFFGNCKKTHGGPKGVNMSLKSKKKNTQMVYQLYENNLFEADDDDEDQHDGSGTQVQKSTTSNTSASNKVISDELYVVIGEVQLVISIIIVLCVLVAFGLYQFWGIKKKWAMYIFLCTSVTIGFWNIVTSSVLLDENKHE